MHGHIVDITGEGRRLSLERGFLNISAQQALLGQVPLDDIEAVILSHPAASMTSQALAALAARGAVVVVCGPDFRPAAFMLPAQGHHEQGDRVEAQSQASLPTRKRLWADIVRAKITAQAAALIRCGVEAGAVHALAGRVQSGDPTNCEAVAAQRYFPLLFGRGFLRNRDGGGINALLNYGYTILRAATARAIVGAGLHPSLSLQHRSRGNALRLADDLMEPFRPTVDLAAHALAAEGCEELDTPARRRLAAVLHQDFATAEGVAPLSNVMAQLCLSLAHIYLGERRRLVLPKSPIPLLAEARLAEARLAETGEDDGE